MRPKAHHLCHNEGAFTLIDILGNIFKSLRINIKLIHEETNERDLICFEGDEREVSTNGADGLTNKVWLLTWNPSNREWDELPTAIQDLRSGKTVHSTWPCMSPHVRPNDRVYLMVLGATYERGVIASGYAASVPYEDAHRDDEKAETRKDRFLNIVFDCILDPDKDRILRQTDLQSRFPLQEWSPQASGISIREEYVNNFEKLWRSVCHGGVQKVSTKQTIECIKDYIAAAGFTYPKGLLENLWLSLKAKPFVILAGISGTGKTRLVRLFANAISAEYKLVAVRPDWSDSSDLFGHVDLNGSFIPGGVLDFMNQAKANPQKPFILCLDEMNLARVEYYLSDVLSIMETRELKNGMIESDPIITESYYGKDRAARERYGIQRIPENFYIIGTVNMDETTFPFSRKVLDRANTIEFSHVDFSMDYEAIPESHDKLTLPNDFLKTDYLFISQCIADKEYVEKVCDALQRINAILQEANAQVGYRVRDEIVFYMLNNKKAGLLNDKEAFDNEIMQKILPRIQGSSTAVKKLLCNLFSELEGSYSDTNGSDSENMLNYIKEKADKLRHPRSANKIFFMSRRFEEDGFTSYWL